MRHVLIALQQETPSSFSILIFVISHLDASCFRWPRPSPPPPASASSHLHNPRLTTCLYFTVYSLSTMTTRYKWILIKKQKSMQVDVTPSFVRWSSSDITSSLSCGGQPRLRMFRTELLTAAQTGQSQDNKRRCFSKSNEIYAALLVYDTNKTAVYLRCLK